MGIIRDMQRAHATQTAAAQRANTAAQQQRELIRRNADLAIAAAQQAASDVERQRERQRLYTEARTAGAAAANAEVRARLSDLDALLLSTLDVDDHIDLQIFKKPVVTLPGCPASPDAEAWTNWAAELSTADDSTVSAQPSRVAPDLRFDAGGIGGNVPLASTTAGH